MTRIRTQTDLLDLLDRDFSWRIREISDVKTSVRSIPSMRASTFLRAGVALLYAHWEGFIKTSSEFYLTFVGSQRLRYEELKTCFIVFGLKKELDFIAASKKHAKNVRAVEFIQGELGKRADLTYKGAINTKANLNSSVFETIATSIGIDPAPYETRYNLIDESLLSRRNRIAHGEFLDIDANEYATLSDEIVILMRSYKSDIENSLALKSYMA